MRPCVSRILMHGHPSGPVPLGWVGGVYYEQSFKCFCFFMPSFTKHLRGAPPVILWPWHGLLSNRIFHDNLVLGRLFWFAEDFDRSPHWSTLSSKGSLGTSCKHCAQGMSSQLQLELAQYEVPTTLMQILISLAIEKL